MAVLAPYPMTTVALIDGIETWKFVSPNKIPFSRYRQKEDL